MHAYIHTYIHTYRQADRQTDRQTDMHTLVPRPVETLTKKKKGPLRCKVVVSDRVVRGAQEKKEKKEKKKRRKEEDLCAAKDLVASGRVSKIL